MSFPPKDPAEIITVTFDFSELAVSVTDPQVSIAPVQGGNDTSADAMRSGAPTISGALVSQKIIAGVDGTSYELRCMADTPDGSRYVIPELLPVARAKPQ